MAIAKDPVCGMEVDTETIAPVATSTTARPTGSAARAACSSSSDDPGDAILDRGLRALDVTAVSASAAKSSKRRVAAADVATMDRRPDDRGARPAAVPACAPTSARREIAAALRSGSARAASRIVRPRGVRHRSGVRSRWSRCARDRARGPRPCRQPGRAGAVDDPGREPDGDHGQEDQDERDDVDDGQLGRALDRREDPHRDRLRAGAGREVRDDDLVERQGEGEQRRRTAAPSPSRAA